MEQLDAQALGTQEKPAKPLGKLFKWLRILFYIYIVSEILVAVGSIIILNTSSVMFGPGEPFTLGDSVQALGAVLLFVSYFACVVLFCMFSYRAVKNLHKFGAKYVETSPGFAVGWYFIPIANLWKPYGVMSEMWQGSVNPGEAYEENPKTMLLWWICWLATSISANASWRMSIRAGAFEEYVTDVSMYKTTIQLDIFASVTGIIAAWFIVRILAVIAESQDGRIDAAAFS